MSPAIAAIWRRLVRGPLWLTFALSLAGLLLLRVWFPLRPHYLSLPLPDIFTLAPGLGPGLAYGGLLLALFALHALAVAQTEGRHRHSPWLLLAAGALLSLPLLTTYPINAADLHRYVITGRLASVYGADPFVVPPSAFPQDPFVSLAGEWADATSPYGPLWELLAGGLTALVGDRFYPALVAFKAVEGLALLGTGGLLWLAGSPGAGRGPGAAARLVAWSWNPALLLLFVGDGHNDALMLLFLVAGWLVGRRGRPGVGLLLALIGALVKPIGLLALPFIFIAGWREASSRGDRARLLLIAGIGGLALTAIAFLPFGSPLALARRLLFESSEVAGFSPATLVVLILERLGLSGSLSPVRAVAGACQAGGGLILLWLAWRGRSALRGIGDVFLLYLWGALAFRIWYAAWPFAWALLDSAAGTRRRAASWFLVTSQLSVLIYGHLWRLALGRDHFWSHLIGVPFVFVLPWLLARLGPGSGGSSIYSRHISQA